jgi:hypothetical protein
MRSLIVRTFVLVVSVVLGATTRAVDVKRFEVLKGVHYYQIGEGVAILQTNNAFRFSAQVWATVVGDVQGASIYTPEIPRIDLLPDKDGDPYRFRDKFDEQFELENGFPNGTYQLGIRGAHDGDHTMSFAINGSSYPAAPVVNDYAGLLNLIYNQSNEISWKPFVGGAAGDFIQVQIEDLLGENVWETPDFGDPGALNGLDTRTIIPPRALDPGAVYVATIRFVKVLASGSAGYPGAVGTAGYFTRTEFLVRPKNTGLDPVVDRLQIWKTLRYEQPFDAALKAQPIPWEFVSRLDTVASNQVSAVNLQIPGWAVPVSYEMDDPTQFDYSLAVVTNKDAFLQMFPAGPYAFDIRRADGSSQQSVINFPAGDFPPAPVLRGYPVYANHPDGEDLTVTWDPWIGATERDFIRVVLLDEGQNVWDTPNYSSLKHLPATATTVTIPGTNFIAGHEMRIEVHFNRVNMNDTRVIPGAFVFGGFDTRTKVTFTNQLPDVVSFRVAEGRYYWQRGINRVEPDANTYRFETTAKAAKTNSLRSAQVVTPRSETFQLAAPISTNKVFRVTVVEGSSASLSNRFPSGLYTMQFDTAADGVRTSSIELPPTDLPPVPLILNFSNVFKITPSGDFTLHWLPWTGADTNTDTIQFTVEQIGGAPFIDSDDSDGRHFVNALSTNVTIFGPHNDSSGNEIDADLVSNRSYIARLRFERRIKAESASYPGARGTAAVFSELAFYISTFSPSYITNFSNKIALTNGLVQINVPTSLALQQRRPYTLFETHDLINWTIARTEILTNYFIRIPPPTDPVTIFKLGIIP